MMKSSLFVMMLLALGAATIHKDGNVLGVLQQASVARPAQTKSQQILQQVIPRSTQVHQVANLAQIKKKQIEVIPRMTEGLKQNLVARSIPQISKIASQQALSQIIPRSIQTEQVTKKGQLLEKLVDLSPRTKVTQPSALRSGPVSEGKTSKTFIARSTPQVFKTSSQQTVSKNIPSSTQLNQVKDAFQTRGITDLNSYDHKAQRHTSTLTYGHGGGDYGYLVGGGYPTYPVYPRGYLVGGGYGRYGRGFYGRGVGRSRWGPGRGRLVGRGGWGRGRFGRVGYGRGGIGRGVGRRGFGGVRRG